MTWSRTRRVSSLLLFVWSLGAIGVAYAAKLSNRGPRLGVSPGMVLTPIGGGFLLKFANRLGWFSKL